MKIEKKLMVALCAAVALFGGEKTQAQGTLIETGSSTLADTFGANSGPEALTISWAVTENASDIYTYAYVVNNPVGDVMLNNDQSTTTTPEIVDAYSIGFNTGAPGAFVAGSQTGGVFVQNTGTGLFWAFNGVSSGSSSPQLSFESDVAPTMGNANALGENPPSPWSSLPSGQSVPVPAVSIVPEPNTASLIGLAFLLFFPARRAFRKKAA